MNSDESEKIKQYKKMTKHDLTQKLYTLIRDYGIGVYDLREEESSWKKMKKAELIIQLIKYEEGLRVYNNEKYDRTCGPAAMAAAEKQWNWFLRVLGLLIMSFFLFYEFGFDW